MWALLRPCLLRLLGVHISRLICAVLAPHVIQLRHGDVQGGGQVRGHAVLWVLLP